MYKLLIADDEVIEREAIKYIVSQNFSGVFEICEVTNGREILERLSSFMPDIVLTDIKMPGISGLEATARIREALPDCRVILISAFHYFNYAKDGLTLGVDDYITKPASEDMIINTLKKAVLHIEALRAKKKKEEEISSKLKNITQYLEEELILLMTSGEIEEKAVREFFDILNIDSSAFICAAVAFPDHNLPEEIGGEIQKRILKKRLTEKLKAMLQSRGLRFFQGVVGQHIYLLILEGGAIDEYEARVLWTKTFSELKDEIFNEMHLYLNIGIGNQCSSVENIFNSFLQAKIALKYDTSPGSVISYGDIRSMNAKSEYPLYKEKSLLEYFLQGDEKNSLQSVDELIDWLTVNLKDTASIRQKVYELLLVLAREAAINLNLTEFNTDSEDMRRNVFLLDTARELRAFAKSYIEKKIRDINNIKTSRANSLLSMVTDYIAGNLHREISLESAADLIKVSPFYLSRLFKKETGSNFIDYLTEYRIKKAKVLLSVPTNNVKDVCYMVGYNDPNYFTRVFKKTCGITPTEYRDKKAFKKG